METENVEKTLALGKSPVQTKGSPRQVMQPHQSNIANSMYPQYGLKDFKADAKQSTF